VKHVSRIAIIARILMNTLVTGPYLSQMYLVHITIYKFKTHLTLTPQPHRTLNVATKYAEIMY